MATRRVYFASKNFSLFRRNIGTKSEEVISQVKDSEAAPVIKDTLWQRWAKYWKNLYIDYKDVAVDVVQGSKERPIRAAVYFSLLGSSFYCAKHNPDADSYREVILAASNQLMMVGEAIRNPRSVAYLKSIEKSYNEGVIRRMNLGIASIIWLDNYDKDCAHYKATCSYLKPQFLGFHHRVVDVGFMNKWYLLDKSMRDFDVNDAEFLVPQNISNFS